MEIAFLDSDTVSLQGDVSFKSIASQGRLECFNLPGEADILQYCRNSEIIITNKVVIGKESIGSLPRLRLICVIATGYNNVDIEAAGKKNVLVANVPEYARFSVPQHTFSLILNLATKACLYDNDVKRGEWEKSDSFNLLKYPCFELNGKFIGIIGMGSIGRETAKIAESLGMQVLAYDISDISHTGYKNIKFDYLINNSDIISIHCPLTDSTKNLIGKKQFQMMKKTALLINTARGSIVNEGDLAWALKKGQIAGAGIDVLSKEPPDAANPLLSGIKNLVITPHTAWSTKEARQRLINITAENIAAFKEGNPVNLVN